MVREDGQGFQGLFVFLFDSLGAGFQAVEGDEGVLAAVHMDRFAQLLGVADDVQHVVPDLEGQADGFSIGPGGFHLFLCGLGGGAAHAAGGGDQRAGLADVDVKNPLLVQLLLLPFHVQHLAAHHAFFPGGGGQNLHLFDQNGGVRFGGGNRIEGRRQKGVAGQDSLGLAEDLVVGQAAPAVVVIVHAGQIVVNQAVGVDHLDGRGEGQGLLPVSPAQAAEFQHKDGPQPLAPSQKAVAHGLEQAALGLAFVGEAAL